VREEHVVAIGGGAHRRGAGGHRRGTQGCAGVQE